MPRRALDPAPPRRVEVDLPRVLETVSQLSARAELNGSRIDVSGRTIDAPHSHLVESEWPGAELDRLDLTGAVLTDFRLVDAWVTEVRARESRWRDVEVESGRIGSLNLLRAELDGVVFRGIRVDYLALPSARVNDLRFVGCEFGTIDLPEALLERVAFDDCRADEVDSRALRAKSVDLRGIEVLAFTDPTSLRGVTLSPRQTEQHGAAFARAWGIDVQD